MHFTKTKQKKRRIWIDGTVFFNNYSGELFSAKGILKALTSHFHVRIFLPHNISVTDDFIKKFNLVRDDIYISQFGSKICLIARFFGFELGLPALEEHDLIFIPNHRVFASKRNQVCLVHDLLPITHSKIIPYFDRFFFRISLKRIIKLNLIIFCHSNLIKEELINLAGVAENKINVLPLGLYLDSLSNMPAPHNKKESGKIWRLLFISAYQKRKNFEIIIDYTKRIRKETGLDIRLTIAGKNLTRVFSSKPESFIYIHDHVTEKYKKKLFVKNNIYINPSSAEGFGITNLEAQFFKMPVMANNIPIFQEILSDTAIFFDVNNFLSFKCGLLELINNKKSRNILIRKGYERAINQNYTLNIEKIFIPRVREALDQKIIH